MPPGYDASHAITDLAGGPPSRRAPHSSDCDLSVADPRHFAACARRPQPVLVARLSVLLPSVSVLMYPPGNS